MSAVNRVIRGVDLLGNRALHQDAFHALTDQQHNRNRTRVTLVLLAQGKHKVLECSNGRQAD